MKIIASTSAGYLVEMTEDEIAKAAGFSGSWDGGWQKAIGDHRGPPIGTTVDVNAAHAFHSRISQHQKEARSSAGILRALADMMDGAMPDVIVPAASAAPEAPASA